MIKLSFLVDTIFRLLFLFLIIGALMTWIPNLPRYKDPYKTMLGICDLFFGPFMKFCLGSSAIAAVGIGGLSLLLAALFTCRVQE